jgi:hypothetical protein
MDLSDQHDRSDWESAARGEAAWKEAREQVASRNDAARKAGKQRREAYVRERDALKAADARRRSAPRGRRTP